MRAIENMAYFGSAAVLRLISGCELTGPPQYRDKESSPQNSANPAQRIGRSFSNDGTVEESAVEESALHGGPPEETGAPSCGLKPPPLRSRPAARECTN